MSLQLNGNGIATAQLNGGAIPSLPAGAFAFWASSDSSVVAVQQSPDNPLQASVTPIAIGSAIITCSITNADGTAVAGTAGETVIANPIPVTVTSVTVTIAETNPPSGGLPAAPAFSVPSVPLTTAVPDNKGSYHFSR